MLSDALRRALDAWPGSLRSLARAAGVAHSTLIRIRDKKFEGSKEMTEQVAKALEQAGSKCKRAAGELRRSLRGRQP
jgi:DNA-binding LacI/PurR family transcriptional regulator